MDQDEIRELAEEQLEAICGGEGSVIDPNGGSLEGRAHIDPNG